MPRFFVWMYALKAPPFPLLCMLFILMTAIVIQSALVCGLVPMVVVVSDSECIERLELSLPLELISAAASSVTHIGHVQVSIVSLHRYVSYWEEATPQHLMCTQELQLSQLSAQWLLATGHWQVMHGYYLMGPGFNSISPTPSTNQMIDLQRKDRKTSRT